MKVIEIGDTYYIARNIAKIRYNSDFNTIGIYMTTGVDDVDWYDCPSKEEAKRIIEEIRQDIEDRKE